MQSDIDHFSTLKPPLAPNTKEVDIYKKYIKGRVLLLGYTAMLYELCTNAMDISPPSTLPFVIKQDWFTINTFYRGSE